jgi:hypothetical protein
VVQRFRGKPEAARRLWPIQHGQNLEGLGFQLFSVDANGPLKLRFVTVKLSLDFVHQWDFATAANLIHPTEVGPIQLAAAVHNGNATVG